jgi:C4-type Zn-finger protein
MRGDVMKKQTLKQKILNKLENLSEEELIELWKTYRKVKDSKRETIIIIDREGKSKLEESKSKDPYLHPLKSDGELAID